MISLSTQIIQKKPPNDQEKYRVLITITQKNSKDLSPYAATPSEEEESFAPHTMFEVENKDFFGKPITKQRVQKSTYIILLI